MQEFLIKLSTEHVFWVYLLVICFASIAGPILSLIFGVLIKLGYFPFLPVYIALIMGDLLGDTAWYMVGRKWGHGFIRRFGKFFSVSESAVEKVTHIFKKYSSRILIISKITNGFGFAIVTLITAGLSRVPFAQYLSLNVIGQFVWSGMLIGVGYYFSHAYLAVDGVLGKMSVIALFVCLIAAFLGFAKYIKGRISKDKI